MRRLVPATPCTGADELLPQDACLNSNEGVVRIHEFCSEVWLPHCIDEVFGFFSDAANLDAITPPWLGFQVLTPAPVEMRVGTLLDYRLRVRGFPIRWRSKITRWKPPYEFVDEQIRGPYRLWIHEHKFTSQREGTLVHDHVRYAVPFDLLLHNLLIRRDVERIFAYRAKCLRRRFGAM